MGFRKGELQGTPFLFHCKCPLTRFQCCMGCKEGGASLKNKKYAKCVFCDNVWCSSADRDNAACVSVPNYPKAWACPECRREFKKSPNKFKKADQKILKSEMNVSQL